MREIDALEVSLSSLSGSSLWQKTGRWNNTEMFKLKDSKGKDFCLVPTCEEEITQLISNDLVSHKNLPLLVYQMTRKYRDEKRPRAGLLRGREFIMKDAYSFHLSKKSAMEMFDKVNGLYRRIFQDLKVPFVSAQADSGDIGGDLSLEWHYLHENGEDSLFTCTSCGTVSNLEKCLSTSEQKSDEVDVSYFTNSDRDTLFCLYYPKGRKLVPLFAKEHIDIDLSFTDESKILSEFQQSEDSFLTKSIVRVMDPRLHDRSNFPDLEVPYHRGSFSTLTDVPLVEADEGDICFECGEGSLLKDKAIEVAHTFFLADRYSKPLSANIKDENGEVVNLEMGCYGIGVSRLVAAIVEMTRDELGLRWPASVAPYQLTFIVAPGEESDKNTGIMDVIANSLISEGFRIQKDLRENVSFGRKILDSKSTGIPLQVIIGKKYPLVEIEVRGERFQDTKLKYEELYESTKEQYQWEIVKNEMVKEKHVLHIDGLADVVRALLEDL